MNGKKGMKSSSTEPISLKNGQSRQTKTNILRRSQKNTNDITRYSLRQKRNDSHPHEKMIMLLTLNLTPLQSWTARSIPSTQQRLTRSPSGLRNTWTRTISACQNPLMQPPSSLLRRKTVPSVMTVHPGLLFFSYSLSLALRTAHLFPYLLHALPSPLLYNIHAHQYLLMCALHAPPTPPLASLLPYVSPH